MRIYIRFVALLATASLILQYGFEIPEKYTPLIFAVNIFIAFSFASYAILRLAFSENKWETIKSYPAEYILLLIIVLQLVVWRGLWGSLAPYLQNINILSLTNLYLAILQFYIVFSLILKLPSLNARIASLRLPPPLLVVSSFALVILVGTLMLMLPKSTKQGISFIDALFTATSATCVTGLTVVDISKYFTFSGQLIILLLIQVGGLGIMTLSSFFALVIRGELGIRERVVLGDILNIRTVGKLRELMGSILFTTIIIEGIGAILLYVRFSRYQQILDSSLLWNAIFHSVSAFCNAGFSLFPTNFLAFAHDPIINIVIMALIVLGGLGFVVIMDLINYCSSFLHREKQNIKLMLQTKIVLKTTLILILGGFLAVLLLESGNTLANMPVSQKILASLFQSVTARTAGFNTIPIGSLLVPTLWVLMVLMFIGASPGGTGGGIKTTTISILVGLIYTRFRGKREVEMSKGTINPYSIFEAIIVFSLSLFIVVTAIFFISIKEHFETEKLMFEVVSAFGTVGLSTGITPMLSAFGRVVLILTMLIGRVGPLSLVLAIPAHRRESKARYLEERLMVG